MRPWPRGVGRQTDESQVPEPSLLFSLAKRHPPCVGLKTNTPRLGLRRLKIICVSPPFYLAKGSACVLLRTGGRVFWARLCFVPSPQQFPFVQVGFFLFARALVPPRLRSSLRRGRGWTRRARPAQPPPVMLRSVARFFQKPAALIYKEHAARGAIITRPGACSSGCRTVLWPVPSAPSSPAFATPSSKDKL